MASAMAVPETVVVHPLVLLSVVDHYSRLSKSVSSKRVVGVLLGSWKGKTLDVANSYALPFEEDEKDPSIWYVDHDYLQEMWGMFRKVNASEKIVGWYHSGPKLRSSDLAINEVIRRFTPNPVLVIVDVKPQELGLPTEAFVAIDEIHDDGTASTKTFTQVPTEIRAAEAEEIGVEHLLRDIKDNAVGTLSTRVTEQLTSLKSLFTHLNEIKAYLDKVVKGELPVNHQITYILQDMFNLLPNVSSPSLLSSFAVKTNDQMLVLYLSSLIRAIISLHSLIANKIANRDAEREIDGDGKKKDEGSKEAQTTNNTDGGAANGGSGGDKKDAPTTNGAPAKK